MRVTSEPFNTPLSVDVSTVLNLGGDAPIVLAQSRQERLSAPQTNPPKEDQLNLPKGSIDFVLTNMLGSVAGQYGLASINPSIRFGIGLQILKEAKRDHSPRGAQMRRLGQEMVDSAAAEFKKNHTRPNTQLVAQAQHAAQNQGEQLIMNFTADVAIGKLAQHALAALKLSLEPLGSKAAPLLEKSSQWLKKIVAFMDTSPSKKIGENILMAMEKSNDLDVQYVARAIRGGDPVSLCTTACYNLKSKYGDFLSKLGFDNVQLKTSSPRGDLRTAGHTYITASYNGKEYIIDPTIGQFLEDYNKVFVGTRDELKKLFIEHSKNIQHISTPEPNTAFERIIGESNNRLRTLYAQ